MTQATRIMPQSNTVPKIISLQTFPVRIPFADGGPGTGGTPSRWHRLDMVLIRIEDEDGHVGWGDAFAYFCLEAVRAAVDHMIAPFVTEAAIDDIAAWNLEVQKKLHLFGRYGITMFALSGVDIALWDLKAKRQGVPLWRLFRANAPTHRPAYASLVRYGDKDLVAEQCKRALERGYRHIKLHEIAPDVIRHAREVIGPGVALMVDANCAWSMQETIALRETFRACNTLWVEEPVFPPDDYKSMEEIEKAAIPVGSGENASTAFDFMRIINAVTYPQPSMTKVGGISEFVKILAACERHGKSVMPHTPYFGPGYLATLAMLPLMQEKTLIEFLFVDPEVWLASTPKPVKGVVSASDRIGIGFEPDLDVLKRYAPRT
ncbi:mandelate racemase/muconate lactonizing enzyme family protein [Bradyrhizobium sp. WYCCWR 13023]|uniref:Mandelate racemase/muconate lactonizing enzyme family protein n=3 Tax=Bradyrhizobium TaxID=374 RepID=A0A9X1RB39_9BRAD|nr:mandelate racemase/muconate lactonizing enzyme family protein [Bradyrhizobium zhengyangense]MCG2628188.1 mandelate racemase/muconate lactonizing enzyme family protein [Bradyrhizobium zhengyangense]MCG2643307.1 mandelate racemase/muconate lactonizing enzyme family protein [Bradyrhizobium zhengyangense]MCG2670379.1 mandelate racemase/muconate lactonizing enzyme family protein [Bradyrhizobium zhengyangense]